MIINTGKLVSNSTQFLKKIKENEGTGNINKDERMTKKILEDFAEVKFNNKQFSTRIKNSSRMLTAYEQKMNENQFIDQKLTEIEEQLQKGNQQQVNSIITESQYNNGTPLKTLFPTTDNLVQQIREARNYISEQYQILDREFKEIEISSQNMLSLYSQSKPDTSNIVSAENLQSLIDTTTVNKARVMDLISN